MTATTPGPAPRKSRALAKPLDMEEVAHRYYELGQSLEQIGREMGVAAGYGPTGVTSMTVRRQMMRMKLPIRAVGFNSARGQDASHARWATRRGGFKYPLIIELGKKHPAPYPIALIASEAGVSYSWACHVLTREGLRDRKFTRQGKKEPGGTEINTKE
jgi:hypothetical protein